MKRVITSILFIIPVISGACALPAVLFDGSQPKNAVFMGLSAYRLLLAGVTVLFIVFAFLMFRNRQKALPFLFYICGFIGLLSGEILIFSRFPSDDTRNMVSLAAERSLPLLIALLVSSISWFLALVIAGKKAPVPFSLFLFTTGVGIYYVISSHIDQYNWRIDLSGNLLMCAASVLAAVLWFFVLHSEIGRGWKTAVGCLFFVILGFCTVRLTGLWMGRGLTPPKAYWNELAEAFLNGKLYLESPSGTHDLTFFNGKWYVPNPPLPGILLIPWVALLRSSEAINMTVYSAVIAGFNTGLMFLMMVLAFTNSHSPLYLPSADDLSYPGRSLSAAVWVTILFMFGTDHFWLGTTGQMWFISQLLVVTFTLLACICVICRFSPVWSGISLALGMLCRPNIFPVWLCLLGIWLHQEHSFPRLDWKKTIVWCLKSGIPVVLSVGLTLLYNKLRFDSWMDFGYVTINGADWILDSVQQYGMFHPHFFATNVDVMLFGLPELDFSCERFFFQPHVGGYSIFLMTPPLIYLFRSFRKTWFSCGAWASVIISVALLLLYHNTGAEQIGYRYILDITAPLALLMGAGMRGKVSLLFKILTSFAIILSFTAIYWWYLGRV